MLGRLGHHCLTKCALSGYLGGNGCGLMLVNGGSGGGEEGIELDEDTVEIAEGDADADDDVVGA